MTQSTVGQVARRPRWIAALALALLIAGLFAALGQWQVGRAVEAAAPDSGMSETTLPLAEVATPSRSITASADGQRVDGSSAFVPGGAEILGGLALVYACGALLAVGLALVLRSTAGGLVTVIALVLVLPPLMAQLPYEWAVTLSSLMPGSSALFLIFGEGPSDDMTTTSTRLTLAAWGVTALLAGGWRLMRTDANR